MEKKKNNFKRIILIIFLVILISIIGFIIYEVATAHNKYYIGEKNLQIPIFVYHHLVEDESQIEFDYMQTTTKTFEKQITGLMKLGYVPISYKDLVKYKNGEIAIPKWSFLITFDDGYESVYKYAFEIAKKYNIPMVSFVIDDQVGYDTCYDWEEAKKMYDSGLIEIYSHSRTHIEYDKAPLETLLEDAQIAYDNLCRELNDNNLLKVFTYPYGLCTNEGIEALKEQGFIQNLTDNKINQSKNIDLSRLHRCYPLNDSILKVLLKIQYRVIRYGS